MEELNYEAMTNEELQRRGFGDMDDEKARHEYQKRARLLHAKEEMAREQEGK